jgi:hypothetical protein
MTTDLNDSTYATADLKVFYDQIGLAQAVSSTSTLRLPDIRLIARKFTCAGIQTNYLADIISSGLSHIRHAQFLPTNEAASIDADAVIAAEWQRLNVASRPLTRE